MDHRAGLAAASRDSHLSLKRAERQQVLVERLSAVHGQRLELGKLAWELGVSGRTVARDVERLRQSGVPLSTHPGRGGGVSLAPVRAAITLALDLPEVAALMSSLAVLGPSVTESAASAMRKLTDAVRVDSGTEPRAEPATDARPGQA